MSFSSSNTSSGDRAISTVFSTVTQPRWLTSLTPPARGPGWTLAQRTTCTPSLRPLTSGRVGPLAAIAGAGPLGDGRFGHPLTHHRTLQQLLPHEEIGGDDALRRLDRFGLEADQAARPIGERPAKVSGQSKIAPIRGVLRRDHPDPVGIVLHPV